MKLMVLCLVQRALVLVHVRGAAAVAFIDERLLVRPHPAVEVERPAVIPVSLADLSLDLSRPLLRIDVVVGLSRQHRRCSNQCGSDHRRTA